MPYKSTDRHRRYNAAQSEGEMPQPKDYGVRLPDLEPGQVWRAA